MKKLYTAVFASLMILSAHAQEIKPKLSPLTKAYLLDLQKTAVGNTLPQGYVYKKRNDGKMCVSAIIKIADGAATDVASKLQALNATIGTKAGRIWTVQVPVENVLAFSQTTGIYYIQIDEPIYPKLDVARKTTRVDSVQGGYGLPMGYSGKGVVVGVMDFGFDYNHPTMFDTLGTRYRIKQVWEMNATGTAPSGYSYGNEMKDTNVIKARGTDNNVETHGTGTTGLSAGSGYGGDTSNRRFRGIAYDADIVLVGVRRDSIGGEWMQGGFSDFIDGVNYIFTYATSVGKPAVANISWGSQSGPHDGTTLINEAFDAMSSNGKIIVMSAGNEGQELIHLNKTFTSTDTSLSTFLTFTPSTYKRTWIDIWGDTAKTFCATTTLYHNGIAGNTTGRVCIDSMTHNFYLIGANGIDTCFVQVLTNPKEFNDKPRTTLNIFNKATDSVGITITGTSGKINVWNEYYYYGFPYQYQSAFSNLGFSWATTGNTTTTVSDMGASKSVLLVGAYASKVKFTNLSGTPLSYSGYVAANQLVPFSSRGPMIDGRISPDITAPGLTIATSYNSWDTANSATGSNSAMMVSKYTTTGGKDYYYGEFSGTSASAPIASGIVALMLQVDPTLDPSRAKAILFATAIQDSYTGVLPAAGNNNWGHGKINAYGAIRELLKTTNVSTVSGKTLDCVLYPNPNNGIFTLDLKTDKTEQMNIQVTNITGAVVLTQKWQVNVGTNQLPLNLSQLPKGTYLVNVSSADGAISIKTMLK